MLHAQVTDLIAVVSSRDVAAILPSFSHVFVEIEDHMQSDSLRAGIARAAEMTCDRALLALGDMPHVTKSLMNQVLETAGESGISAISDGDRRMPPACFSSASFPELLATEGDRGAASLLRSVPEDMLVHACPESLVDIDVPADLVPPPK